MSERHGVMTSCAHGFTNNTWCPRCREERHSRLVNADLSGDVKEPEPFRYRNVEFRLREVVATVEQDSIDVSTLSSTRTVPGVKTMHLKMGFHIDTSMSTDLVTMEELILAIYKATGVRIEEWDSVTHINDGVREFRFDGVVIDPAMCSQWLDSQDFHSHAAHIRSEMWGTPMPGQPGSPWGV